MCLPCFASRICAVVVAVHVPVAGAYLVAPQLCYTRTVLLLLLLLLLHALLQLCLMLALAARCCWTV
jgi:hypothetical protein